MKVVPLLVCVLQVFEHRTELIERTVHQVQILLENLNVIGMGSEIGGVQPGRWGRDDGVGGFLKLGVNRPDFCGHRFGRSQIVLLEVRPDVAAVILIA